MNKEKMITEPSPGSFEIVGHAAPTLVDTETGNAVKNENIVRKELYLLEREDDHNE